MAELPIMPMKVAPLLADTTNMSAEEFGAYCRILFAMWLNGSRLHDDQTELARIAGVTRKRWAKIAPSVMRPLTVAGGEVSQKRLTDTWLSVRHKREVRADAAQSRWHGNGHANPVQKPSKADAKVEHAGNLLHGVCTQNQNKNGDLLSSSEQEAARARGANPEQEKSELEQGVSTRSLASALPTGALTRGSSSVPVSDALKESVRAKGWAR